MLKKNQQQRGISLLELMLSIAIIAVLIITASRYYATTHSSQQVNDATNMLQTVMTASDNWFWTYKSFTPTSGDISIEALANRGLVPINFMNTHINPWSGAVTVIPGENGDAVTIELTKVNSNDCLNLSEIMAKRGLNGACTEGDNNTATYSGTYVSANPDADQSSN